MLTDEFLERAKRVAAQLLTALQAKYTFTAPVELADLKHVYAELREACEPAYFGVPIGVEVYEQRAGALSGESVIMRVWLYGVQVPGGLCIIGERVCKVVQA